MFYWLHSGAHLSGAFFIKIQTISGLPPLFFRFFSPKRTEIIPLFPDRGHIYAGTPQRGPILYGSFPIQLQKRGGRIPPLRRKRASMAVSTSGPRIRSLTSQAGFTTTVRILFRKPFEHGDGLRLLQSLLHARPVVCDTDRVRFHAQVFFACFSWPYSTPLAVKRQCPGSLFAELPKGGRFFICGTRRSRPYPSDRSVCLRRRRYSDTPSIRRRP